jgi:hypothetical protein
MSKARRDIGSSIGKYAMSDCHNKVLAYLNMAIDELRKSNDEAPLDNVQRNQGGISALKLMRKEVAANPDAATRDGAYTP